MISNGLARIIVACALICAAGAAVPPIFAFERQSSERLAVERHLASAVLSDLPIANPIPGRFSGSGACRRDWRGSPAVFVAVRYWQAPGLRVFVNPDWNFGRPVPRLVISAASAVGDSRSIVEEGFTDFEASSPLGSDVELVDAIKRAQTTLAVRPTCVVVRLDQQLSVRDAYRIEASVRRVPQAQLQIFSELALDD